MNRKILAAMLGAVAILITGTSIVFFISRRHAADTPESAARTLLNICLQEPENLLTPQGIALDRATFSSGPDVLSEADRLNGIAYHGNLIVNVPVKLTKETEWQDRRLYFYVLYKNGLMQITPNVADMIRRLAGGAIANALSDGAVDRYALINDRIWWCETKQGISYRAYRAQEIAKIKAEEQRQGRAEQERQDLHDRQAAITQSALANEAQDLAGPKPADRAITAGGFARIAHFIPLHSDPGRIYQMLGVLQPDAVVVAHEVNTNKEKWCEVTAKTASGLKTGYVQCGALAPPPAGPDGSPLRDRPETEVIPVIR